MHRSRLTAFIRIGAVVLVLVVGFFGLRTGPSFGVGDSHASQSKAAPAALPCQFGGLRCMSIGFTEAWLGGSTVDLGFSHQFFCWHPPTSRARSGCEAGANATVNPPSGPVVSPIWDIIPLGFTPPQSTLQCPKPGQCIDQPATIDLARVGGGDSNATFPAHSQIIKEDESFQSTWWPVVIVGVKSLSAWNQLVAAKSWDAMYSCQLANKCTPDTPTNAFEWFQVLGPGMSPGGPN